MSSGRAVVNDHELQSDGQPRTASISSNRGDRFGASFLLGMTMEINASGISRQALSLKKGSSMDAVRGAVRTWWKAM